MYAKHVTEFFFVVAPFANPAGGQPHKGCDAGDITESSIAHHATCTANISPPYLSLSLHFCTPHCSLFVLLFSLLLLLLSFVFFYLLPPLYFVGRRIIRAELILQLNTIAGIRKNKKGARLIRKDIFPSVCWRRNLFSAVYRVCRIGFFLFFVKEI
jgi:hypothetical protein